MSRLIFEARRRLAPPVTRKGTINIEAPPELPRVIPPSFLRRAMPYVLVILIVGMVVALFATGMRLISPQTLFFPFVLLLAASAMYRGNDNKARTEEVDAERADYLRYLSVVRDNIRTQAAQQRAAAEWSHPEPTALASVPGSRRQWERDPHDPDFLVLRAGRHQVPLTTALRVNDTADEIDLEPVSHSALRSLLDTHRIVRDVPTGIDLTKVSRITVLGEEDDARAAMRAWIAQAVTWHDPTVLGVALVARDLESPDWSWLKWLPHTDVPGELDGVGPARFLATNPDELVLLLGPAFVDRPAFTGEPADALRHLLIVVDDPDFDLNTSTLALGRAGVTVVHRSATPPHREQYSDPEKPILRVSGGGGQPSRRHRALADRRLAALPRRRRPVRRRRGRPPGAPTVALGLQPDPHRAALGRHARCDLHHAARHPGRLAAGRAHAVGAAPPRGRVARAHRRHRDRRAAGLRPEGRSRGRDGPARPDDRYDGLREVPNPDVDLVGAVDNPSGGPADRDLRRLQG